MNLRSLFQKCSKTVSDYFIDIRKKCTLRNLVDLSVMSVFALANAVMSAEHPYVTTLTTAAAIGLSHAVDVISNRSKINKLKKLKVRLGLEVEHLELTYPIMSKGKWLFFSVSASCLACYVAVSIFSAVSGIPVSALEMAAVIGASTIFHLAKKFYNSPLARDIDKLEKQHEEKMVTLRTEKEELEKLLPELQYELNDLRTRYKVSNGENRELRKQLDECAQKIPKLQEFVDSLEKRNTELVAKSATLQEEDAQLRKAEGELFQRLSTTAEMLRLLDKVAADENGKLLKLAGKCETLQDELYTEREKSRVIEESHNALMLEIERVNKTAVGQVMFQK